ncbi:MAG TPA: carboxypeptidase-like regulatory domain-containing protein [Planctomycetaceae bacterium]|nr:carboxypeptidase-like regulatory domain-containing protein [Planctomycetaceae bacterium]
MATKSMHLGFCLLGALWMLGCGGSGGKPVTHPATTPVSGTVTLKGTPVEGATVTLHPIQKGNGAFGVTDASGKYVLGTFETADGAVPGEYKVSIVKLSSTDGGKQPAPGEPGYDPNATPAAPKHLVPEKYTDFTKSGLSAKIDATPKTDLDFKLE